MQARQRSIVAGGFPPLEQIVCKVERSELNVWRRSTFRWNGAEPNSSNRTRQPLAGAYSWAGWFFARDWFRVSAGG